MGVANSFIYLTVRLDYSFHEPSVTKEGCHGRPDFLVISFSILCQRASLIQVGVGDVLHRDRILSKI